jgi:predicted transcriptional regulator
MKENHMKENANTHGMAQLLDETMVRELVEDGLIVQKPGTPQPTFSLTPEGKRKAQELIKGLHAKD